MSPLMSWLTSGVWPQYDHPKQNKDYPPDSTLKAWQNKLLSLILGAKPSPAEQPMWLNALAPINRLPNEILIDIACRYCECSRPRSSHRQEIPFTPSGVSPREIFRLMLVCKRWYIVLQNAVCVWSQVNATDGYELVTMALERSRSILIDVELDRQHARLWDCLFFELALEHSERWRSLVVVHAPHETSWPSFLMLLMGKFPSNLETLVLRGRYRRHFAIPIGGGTALFDGNPAPRTLKCVSLSVVPLAFGRLRLTGLRSLILEDITTPTLEDILGILVGSPELEVFTLHGWPGSQRNSIYANIERHISNYNIPTLHFECLTDLKMTLVPSNFVDRLLSKLGAPKLRYLTVMIDWAEPLALGDLYPTIRYPCLIADSPSYSITFGQSVFFSPTDPISFGPSYYYQVNLGGLEVGCFIHQERGSELDRVTSWIDMWFRGDQSFRHIPAAVQVQSAAWGPSDLEWFTRQATVTTLHLAYKADLSTEFERIIHWLERPISLSSLVWPLPAITALEFTLHDQSNNLDIVEMIGNRHNSYHEGSEEKRDYPARLQRVLFTLGVGYRRDSQIQQELFQRALIRAVAHAAPGARVVVELV
ncbi:hypothetical protein FRB90_006247 [Tulasnella sp. 427]|nr:hypothetical protein FRB90_006247 [Tulasnella sp. 427]